MNLRRTAVTLGTAGMLAGGLLAGPASAAPIAQSTYSAPAGATAGTSIATQAYYPWNWDYQRGYRYGYWSGSRDARYDCQQDYPHPSSEGWSDSYRRGFWEGYRRGYWNTHRDYCDDGGGPDHNIRRPVHDGV